MEPSLERLDVDSRPVLLGTNLRDHPGRLASLLFFRDHFSLAMRTQETSHITTPLKELPSTGSYWCENSFPTPVGWLTLSGALEAHPTPSG